VTALRMQLRARYQFDDPREDTANTCLAICCPALSIAQDARHIQNSVKAGYELPFVGPSVGITGLVHLPQPVPFAGASHRLGNRTDSQPPGNPQRLDDNTVDAPSHAAPTEAAEQIGDNADALPGYTQSAAVEHVDDVGGQPR